MQRPDSPEIQGIRDTPVVPEGLEPAMKAQYERNEEGVRNRLESSYNQNIPQNVRENTRLEANRGLASDYGNMLLQSDYNKGQAELQKKYALAGLTAPQLVQSGSSGYSSQIQPSSGFWGSLVSGGASVGAAAIIA